jgi:chemotaxis protein CheZ
MADAVLETVSEFAGRLSALRYRYPKADPRLLADVMRAILGLADDQPPDGDPSLLHQVEELGHAIATAKAEIAALRVDDITDNHIPSATDELDAIVAHTASATDQILETCETLDQVASVLEGEPAAQLQDATTRIYEACSFQDITGQRITKVVATLKTIDAKVAQMLSTFSPQRPRPEFGAVPPDEAMLLNGPQLPGNAMDQSDIDKLLASFD